MPLRACRKSSGRRSPRGVRSGKYASGEELPADSRAANAAINGFINSDWLKPGVLKAVQSLKPLAAQVGLTLPQFALAWVLRLPNIAAAVIGASRPEQIDETVTASGRTVEAHIYAAAERIIDAAAER